jgi:rod shape-determining protein MreD
MRLGGAARLGAALLLVLALLLQRTVLPLLPWGPADLITVMVASVGILAGPSAGCVGGFAVGLAADAMSDHAVGRLAAVLCVVGYLCGLVPTTSQHRMRVVWVTVTAAAVLTPLLFALTGAFVGDNRAAGTLLLTRCLAGLAYGFVLAPFVYPLMHRLLSPRRVRQREAQLREPRRLRRRARL